MSSNMGTGRNEGSQQRSTLVHKGKTDLGKQLDQFDITMNAIEYVVTLHERKHDNIRPINVTVTNKRHSNDSDFVAVADLAYSDKVREEVRAYIRRHLIVNLKLGQTGEQEIDYISLAAKGTNLVNKSMSSLLIETPKSGGTGRDGGMRPFTHQHRQYVSSTVAQSA